jgi:hypothetical protein
MVWLYLVFITPPTPRIERWTLSVEGQLGGQTLGRPTLGSRCGLRFIVSRGLEAQVTSNHPMFLPPSSLDYRTEPLVPAILQGTILLLVKL